MKWTSRSVLSATAKFEKFASGMAGHRLLNGYGPDGPGARANFASGMAGHCLLNGYGPNGPGAQTKFAGGMARLACY